MHLNMENKPFFQHSASDYQQIKRCAFITLVFKSSKKTFLKDDLMRSRRLISGNNNTLYT